MSTAHRNIGRWARSLKTKGEEIWYGILATHKSKKGRVVFIKSPSIRSNFVFPPNRFLSSPTILLSSSIAVTFFAASRSSAVRLPVPGPISSTMSVERTAERAMIFLRIFWSTRICWPNALLKVIEEWGVATALRAALVARLILLLININKFSFSLPAAKPAREVLSWNREFRSVSWQVIRLVGRWSLVTRLCKLARWLDGIQDIFFLHAAMRIDDSHLMIHIYETPKSTHCTRRYMALRGAQNVTANHGRRSLHMIASGVINRCQSEIRQKPTTPLTLSSRLIPRSRYIRWNGPTTHLLLKRRRRPAFKRRPVCRSYDPLHCLGWYSLIKIIIAFRQWREARALLRIYLRRWLWFTLFKRLHCFTRRSWHWWNLTNCARWGLTSDIFLRPVWLLFVNTFEPFSKLTSLYSLANVLGNHKSCPYELRAEIIRLSMFLYLLIHASFCLHHIFPNLRFFIMVAIII